jgi:RNA polymerase sigma factor (sigma-70 family)
MKSFTNQLYPALLRQAALLLSGSAAAQAMQPSDLLHMAVEKLCRRPSIHIEEQPWKFQGLMRTIMQRTIIDEQRKARAARRPDMNSACPLEEALHVAVDSSDLEVIGLVHESLQHLEARNPSAARLLRLHFLEGRTGVELAAACGVTTGCISRRISAAVSELRESMLALGDLTPQVSLAA